MTVITVSRELGSGGAAVAGRVAHALGCHLVDRPVMEKVLESYGVLEFPQVYDGAPSLRAGPTRTTEVLRMLDRTVEAVARHGDVVLLGRAGYAVLGGFSDVLHVRIQAPFAVRVERLRERLGRAHRDEAEARVREADRVRASFLESKYGSRWDSASAFHLVIDTSATGLDLAARFVLEAAREFADRPAGDRPVSAIEVDEVLASTVAEVLGCTTVHAARGGDGAVADLAP